MHYSIGQMQLRQIISTSIVAAVLLSFLLVLATSASAESAGAVSAISAATGESLASTESTPLPNAAGESDAAAPEPVEATEAAADTTSAIAESEPPTSSPAPGSLRSTGAAVTKVVEAVPQAKPDAVGETTNRAVSELAGEVRQSTARTVAPVMDSAETVAQISDRAASGGHIPALPQHPLQVASNPHEGKALQDVRGLIAPDGVENLQSLVEAPSGADVEASPHQMGPWLPGTLPIGAHPYVQVTILNRLLLQHPAELEGVESPSARGNLAIDATAKVLAATAGALLHDVGGGRPENPASLPLNSNNTPTPPPESPSIAASGWASSSFVPVAALLALLALAAPAILRRLREVPDFPAPAPFVCALERPG